MARREMTDAEFHNYMHQHRVLCEKHHRREALILLTAPKGDVRAARGLVGRAIREALDVKQWLRPGHWVCYSGVYREILANGEKYEYPARFTLDVSDKELNKLQDVICRMAKDEEWSNPPVDIYHD